MSDERASDGVVIRLITWAARPLSFYWTLAGVALCVAVVQTIRTGEVFWEGLTAAATIAAVARLLAHVRRTSLLVLLALIGVIGCGSADAPARAHVVRETLPGGAVLLRYASLKAPVAEPVAADLRIGVLEGEPHEVFGDVRAIEADEDGTIYVLDHQASEVRAFDADGRFLRTLTRKGKGPAELTAANGMVFARDGTLWIQDHGQWRMVGVNRQGEELGRFQMHVLAYGYVWDGALDDRGRFWKSVTHSVKPPVFPPEPGLNESVARVYQKWLDPATGAMDSVFLGEVTHRGYVEVASSSGWRGSTIPFTAQAIVLVDPAGGFWTMSGDAYRIARLDGRGDTVLVVEVDVPPEPVTAEDRRRYVESVAENTPDRRSVAEEIVRLAPATKPVIDQLVLDDEGRLWVRRRADADELPLYDLFTRDGEHLASVRLAFRPVTYLPPRIRYGKLYALTTDSLGVHSVVRATLPPLLRGSGR